MAVRPTTVNEAEIRAAELFRELGQAPVAGSPATGSPSAPDSYENSRRASVSDPRGPVGRPGASLFALNARDIVGGQSRAESAFLAIKRLGDDSPVAQRLLAMIVEAAADNEGVPS